MATKKDVKVIHLMFLYREQGSDGKAYNSFTEVDGETYGRVSKAERMYPRTSKVIRKTRLANPMCGGVYSVEVGESDGSIIPATAKYVGRTNDKKLITELQALDQTNRDIIDAAAAEAREQKYDYVLDQLEPIRRTYLTMRGKQRTVFLARVVRLITGETRT